MCTLRHFYLLPSPPERSAATVVLGIAYLSTLLYLLGNVVGVTLFRVFCHDRRAVRWMNNISPTNLCGKVSRVLRLDVIAWVMKIL